jgi:putative ABC transport system permease protein
MQIFMQDLQYGLRRLRKSPGFTAVVVLTLGLGIGANTAIFSFVNAVFLRPLPVVVKEPGRLVWLFTHAPNGPRFQDVSYPEYVEYRDQREAFSDVLAFQPMVPFSLQTQETAERVWGALVSGNFFSVLGVRAAAGRTFLAEEDQTPNQHPVVVLSHRLWRHRFGGDPAIVGRTVSLNRHVYTVVGVADERFTGPIQGFYFDVYVPLMMHHQVAPNAPLLSNPKARPLSVLARLKPGVSLEQSRAVAETRARQLELAFPETNRGRGVRLVSAKWGNPKLVPTALAVGASVLLMSVVGLVLLTACGNISHLLLARATERQKEMAIRAALGATRNRIVRQLLAESVLLALLGGALALVLSSWTTRLLTVAKPPIDLPFGLDLGLDGAVLGFTVALSLLTSLLFGLMPALQASRPDLVTALKDVPRGLSTNLGLPRFRQMGVVSQTAISLLLLIVAGLFLGGANQAGKIDPGFDPKNCLLLGLDLKLQGYSPTQARWFNQQLQERLLHIPGIGSVGLAQNAPLGFARARDPVVIPGYDPPGKDAIELDYALIGRSYFQTLGIPFLRGRDFAENELKTPPSVTIINETMARRFWPKQDPVGQQLRLYGPSGPVCEVIGIVKDSKYYSLGESPIPFAFLPLSADHLESAVLCVRTRDRPSDLVPAIRAELQALDAQMPFFSISTLQEHVRESLQLSRMGAVILILLGLLSALLASVGNYGVASYSMKQRMHEIGVRLALGAQRGDLERQLLRESVLRVMIGIGIGLVAAACLSPILVTGLPGLGATDLVLLGGITLGFILVAVGTCYLPAHRAAKADPMTALRCE